MKDAGQLTIYGLTNTAENGDMPVEKLIPVTEPLDFEEKAIGFGRQYAAKGANEQVDLLARVWRTPARIGQYVTIAYYEGFDDGTQFRIDNVQQVYDDDGLKVTDLTLSRLEEYYDVAGED